MYDSRWLRQPNTTLYDIKSNLLSRPLWRNLAVLVFLLSATWLPRGLALDRLVTPDEPTWLTSSGDFYQALAQGDFANTYQLEHPGVTTLWAGTAGLLWQYPAYAEEGPGQHDWGDGEIGPFLRAKGYSPVDVLVAARLFMVLGITIVLSGAFLLAVRLLGFWTAAVGFLFVAFDPFHIAHSRLLHLDGMASGLVLLALLAFLNYLYRGHRPFDLVLSAFAAGLAWLTKSPTLFLVPLVGLLLLLEVDSKWHRERRLSEKEIRWVAQSLIIWGIVGLAVFVLLWPAMWVDPLYTLWRVLRATVGYAAKGHEEQLYFQGAIIDGDPGASFYPLTYLWRTTPFVLMGLGLAAVAFAAPRTRLLPSGQWRPLAALLLFAVFFTVFMSLGAKKFDRYLLPVYLPLNLVAGVGWMAAARWLQALASQAPLAPHRRWLRRLTPVAAPAIVLLALAGQAGSAFSAFPYYLSYYNPLLGGTVAAPEVMMVGWGEGLDQAARYLDSQPGAAPPSVIIGVWTGTFSYFYNGEIRPSSFAPEAASVRDWQNSDYCVIYINQWQRGRLPQELLEHLANLTPVQTIRLQGLDYVYIYDIGDVLPPDYMLAQPLGSVGQQGSRVAEKWFSSLPLHKVKRAL